MIKDKPEKTREQALEALRARCARAEVCTSDARRLMVRWGVPAGDFDWVITKLTDEKFIDEQRYADAYVRDKMNFSRWGERKISEALHAKRIPRSTIARAMEQIDSGSMTARLEADLLRKMNSLKEEDRYKLKDKLLRFGMSRGFGYEEVAEAVEKLFMAC